MNKIDKYNFSGKKAIIRVDFNVPLNEKMEITDASRITAALPTIKKVLDSGGSVILMSHLGRPKDAFDEEFSLKHIIQHLSDTLQKEVLFAPNAIGDETQERAKNLKHGEVLLLENLRFHKEEKKGDKNFARKLSELADVYINDAFGTAHRAHASTTIIADFFPNDKMFGYIMENEIKNIDKLINGAKKPITAILGGSKVSTKINIIENLMPSVDNMIIAGGMAYTFIKAQGGKIGNSLVENDKLDLANEILSKAKTHNVNLVLPIDTIISDDFSENGHTKECPTKEIPDDWEGLDIGKKTIDVFTEIIIKSAIILWNGPTGVFEMDKFSNGTKQVAQALVIATQKGAFTLVGGGDSVAAINKFKLADKVSYVSTGGGALLEYIEGKVLPGIKAMID